jgi:hypothetical protein
MSNNQSSNGDQQPQGKTEPGKSQELPANKTAPAKENETTVRRFDGNDSKKEKG